jgi:hypothetical protein
MKTKQERIQEIKDDDEDDDANASIRRCRRIDWRRLI